MKRKRNTSKGLQVTQVFAFDEESPSLTFPLAVAKISAGFPSPADDYIDERLDLNDLLVKHPAATHFVRVEGDSMIDAGIHSGDILVVDRALEPTDRKVVIAVVDGDLTVKRVRKSRGRLYLAPENQAFRPIEITGEMDFEVWGVVTYVIHAV
jgi:DNA polymerase V